MCVYPGKWYKGIRCHDVTFCDYFFCKMATKGFKNEISTAHTLVLGEGRGVIRELKNKSKIIVSGWISKVFRSKWV